MKPLPTVLLCALVAALSLAHPALAWSAASKAESSKQVAKKVGKKKTTAKRKSIRKKSVAAKNTATQPAARQASAVISRPSEPHPSVTSVSAALPHVVVGVPALTLTTQLRELPTIQAEPIPVSPVIPLLPAVKPPAVAPAALAKASDPALVKPSHVAIPPAQPPTKPWQPRVQPVEVGGRTASGGNPYLANPQKVNQPLKDASAAVSDFKLGLPSIPSLGGLLPTLPEGLSVLPVIKTVYPTGEKPLVIVTFKCPTELVGITPLPTKALHDVVTWGMDTINDSNLLAFNMQQVCQ